MQWTYCDSYCKNPPFRNPFCLFDFCFGNFFPNCSKLRREVQNFENQTSIDRSTNCFARNMVTYIHHKGHGLPTNKCIFACSESKIHLHIYQLFESASLQLTLYLFIALKSGLSYFLQERHFSGSWNDSGGMSTQMGNLGKTPELRISLFALNFQSHWLIFVSFGNFSRFSEIWQH